MKKRGNFKIEMELFLYCLGSSSLLDYFWFAKNRQEHARKAAIQTFVHSSRKIQQLAGKLIERLVSNSNLILFHQVFIHCVLTENMENLHLLCAIRKISDAFQQCEPFRSQLELRPKKLRREYLRPEEIFLYDRKKITAIWLNVFNIVLT